MNSLRDHVLVTVAIVALAMACFGGGWWMGRVNTTLERQDARIAALERGAVLAHADALRAERAQPSAAAARARPSAPEAPAAPVKVDVAGAPALGPANAPVTLVAFLDFQCPYCARSAPTLERLTKEYGNRLRLVFKHFPLPMHAHALDAAKAAQAAEEQGKFWPMHDRIFKNRNALDPKSLRADAKAVGLDMAAYDAAVKSPQVLAKIQADIAEGQRVGVHGTPTFVLNGSLFSGALPYDAMKARVDQALAQAKAPAVGRAAPTGAGR